MTFGITSGIELDSDGDRLEVLEALGHMLAWWMTSPVEVDFDTFRTRAQDIFDVALGIDALLRLTTGAERARLARRAVTHSWLEAREVLARANVLGTVHTRYGLGRIEMDGVEADQFRLAATAASTVITMPTARVAFKDFGFSLSQRGDDAFLYAYRAVENIRRTYAPDKVSSGGDTKPNWPPMHAALGTSEQTLKPLTDAATCIRHGNSSGPALVAARTDPARTQTLALADHVLYAFLSDKGIIGPHASPAPA